MTEKTLTTENIKPALDALRGELAPWPVVAKKQDRLNTAQLNAANSGITSSLVAQIIANTAAIRALESAITGTGLRALVVASLPAIGTQGILYIVPVTTYDPDTDADVVNYSNEYLWIVAPDAPVTEGYYEQVGQTGIVINNGQLTITVNGTSVGTFTANQSGDTTAAITVPTNADYVDLTTDQTVAGVKTFSSTINGTASKAIADEDGDSIKTSYGKLSGNQTWTGFNIYEQAIRIAKTSGDSEIEIVNKNIDITSNAATEMDDIRFMDKNGKITGGLRVTYNNTQVQNSLSARSWSSDGTAYSNVAINIVSNYQNSAAYISVTNDFLPTSTNTIRLGNASYQWSAVYAQTYFYNGTEIQNKFVTLDTSQTISGLKYFSSNILHKTPQTVDVSTNPAEVITGKGLQFVDNVQYWGDITPQWTTDGTFRIRIAMTNYNTSGTSTGWFCPIVLDLARDGSKVDIWSTHPNSNLGTSTNKWKTLNGVNPGALSLPDNSKSVTVDTTNYTWTGSDNTYVAPADGWLSLKTTTGLSGRLEGTTTGIGSIVERSAGGRLVLLHIPVLKNESVTVSGVGSDFILKFYPCLGNV